MAKRRFRDIKQGRIQHEEEKRKNSGDMLDHAGKIERIKAFITDSFMLVMPIMYLVIYVMLGSREDFAEQKMAGWVYILVPYIMITTIFIAKSGQTPGMRAYNIKVVDISDGELIGSVSRIVIRQVLGIADFFLFGWISMFFREDNRTLHEIFTGSSMIRTETPGR